MRSFIFICMCSMRCFWCMAALSPGGGVCAEAPAIQPAESAIATLAASTLAVLLILEFIVFSILLVSGAAIQRLPCKPTSQRGRLFVNGMCAFV